MAMVLSPAPLATSATSTATAGTPHASSASPLLANGPLSHPTLVGIGGDLSASNGPEAAATPTVENVMDELMLQYLKKRGYHIVPPTPGHSGHASAPSSSLQLMNGTAGSLKTDVIASDEERLRFLGDHRIDANEDPAVSSLERYARQLGLTTEACTANHILFYGLSGGDPSVYIDAYAKLIEWVCNSLDMYTYELHAVAFPVFVHCYLELLMKGYVDEAKSFFVRFSVDHMRLHVEELRELSLLFTPDHVRSSEYAKELLHSKFNVQISLLSFELLNSFLGQEQLFVMLSIVNARVNLVVTSNQPGMLLEQLEDATSVDGMQSIVRVSSEMTQKSSNDIAKVIAASATPNDSEIAAAVTSGVEYDVEYMVQSAGGEGSTLEDLNAIKIKWGVFPPHKIHDEDDTEDASQANGGKGDDAGAGNSTSTTNGPGGSSGSGEADSEKKTSGTLNGTAEGAAGDSNGPSKGGEKSTAKAGSSADKSSGATANDSQRKTKRARLGTDADERRKSELDVVGPLPDRKNAFNSQILERLVLRQPAEMKAQAVEDFRARASLNKTALPSALCFSIVNSGGSHVNNLSFSGDVTMVGASCDDGSFRVWRNDDQPLGTARGAVYHGDVVDTDEDERTAVLRGHSSAVYGADFSPDNRFAMTASGDSTVRLWSLAAKSNVVIYRSHEGYPVWNVRFSRYGYYFASCSMDRTARLWSTDHMTPLRVFAGHLSDVDCIEFHPNQNYLATGSSDKTVRLWDVQTGKCVRVFTGHFHGVKTLAFSSNGRYLASSGDDQYINVWDLQAGKRLETLVGHRAPVTSLSFSQESTILASGGMDSTVRLWDMQSIVDKPAHSIPRPADQPQFSSLTIGAKPQARALHMVRPSAIHELPPSRFLLKTLRSKQTPIHRVQFTPRNLLLTGGVFGPKVDS